MSYLSVWKIRLANHSPVLSAGDFSGLAADYSAYRPDYSESVLTALLGLLEKPIGELDFVDVGAGTGIWTRMVNEKGTKTTTAVEPNLDMLQKGIEDSKNTEIIWVNSPAERLNLRDKSQDWLTMASSFHWVDFNKAIFEFKRVLRAGGWFTALWNPRIIETNPILVEIEAHLKALNPSLKRVSSGHSGITNNIEELLNGTTCFEDIVYLEGHHNISMTPERYMGVWRSVNDVRVQLGSEKFEHFLSFVEEATSGLNTIETTYLTRAWSARKVG